MSMIRFLVLGLAAIAATHAGSVGARFLMTPKAAEVHGEQPIPLEYIKLDPVSVPIIRHAKVQGYVIAKVVVAADAADVKVNKPALTTYSNEAVFRAIYEEGDFDFSKLKPVQIATLAERMTALANGRMGRQAIRQSAVESLSFINQADLKDNRGR